MYQRIYIITCDNCERQIMSTYMKPTARILKQLQILYSGSRQFCCQRCMGEYAIRVTNEKNQTL